MKLKEKKISSSAEAEITAKRTLSPVSALFLSALFGFLAAGTKLGGNGAPLCAAMTASLPPFSGFAAFAGAMGSFFINDTFSSGITEIITMPAVIFSRAMLSSVFGRKITPAVSAGLAAAGYIICGLITAMTGRITAALIMAIIFRGIVCGTAAYFSSKLFAASENGSVFSAETKISLAVVYALIICMLCGISFGAFNAGRIAGIFVTAAAAFRYGFAGGAAAGALSAFAFGAMSPSMTSTAAIVVCAGAAAGFWAKKGKLSSAAVFIAAVFAGSLVYGMPSDSALMIVSAIRTAVACQA